MRARLAALALFAALPARAADTTPFFRMAAPNVFTGTTTTPHQVTIVEPVGATSYRFVNSCFVDVRIITVANTSATVTATTGTLFLARTAETLASSVPLTPPPNRIVSIMTMADPGAAGCAPELTYGTGQ